MTTPNFGFSYPSNSLFNVSTQLAKIQGLSILVGELFAELYEESRDGDKQLMALEAYKNLRRLLPLESSINNYMGDRHVGASAAHNATQGL